MQVILMELVCRQSKNYKENKIWIEEVNAGMGKNHGPAIFLWYIMGVVVSRGQGGTGEALQLQKNQNDKDKSLHLIKTKQQKERSLRMISLFIMLMDAIWNKQEDVTTCDLFIAAVLRKLDIMQQIKVPMLTPSAKGTAYGQLTKGWKP